jgi:hypothetical protein
MQPGSRNMPIAGPDVQAWYRNAELTEAGKIRFPFKKCCDHADVVKAQFRVNRTDGGDEWYYEDQAGHFKRIPLDVIHWSRSAPGRQADPVRFFR